MIWLKIKELVKSKLFLKWNNWKCYYTNIEYTFGYKYFISTLFLLNYYLKERLISYLRIHIYFILLKGQRIMRLFLEFIWNVIFLRLWGRWWNSSFWRFIRISIFLYFFDIFFMIFMISDIILINFDIFLVWTHNIFIKIKIIWFNR